MKKKNQLEEGCKIILTDFIIEGMKESHGNILIPILHKLHKNYIELTNHLTDM